MSQLLSAVLERAVRALWPRRSQRELLLDLGERKGWTEEDCSAAIERVAIWLQHELLLPPTLPVSAITPVDARAAARRLGDALEDEPAPSTGVARWAVALAPALGTSGKTLANSLTRPLRSDRPDHRWLNLLVRAETGRLPVDAWLYHRRSPELVAEALARVVEGQPLDAGDAVLVLSLLALWQRRRAPSEARANRGTARPRGVTPKPISAVYGTLASAGQLTHLSQVAGLLDAAGDRAIVLLAIEAALTEAHLAPHRARRGSNAPMATGEEWLRAVEHLLDEPSDRLRSESDLIRFRIARMRSYRDRVALPVPARDVVRNPYVRASMLLEQARGGPLPSAAVERFDPATPGILMHLPQLRSRDLLVLT